MLDCCEEFSYIKTDETSTCKWWQGRSHENPGHNGKFLQHISRASISPSRRLSRSVLRLQDDS